MKKKDFQRLIHTWMEETVKKPWYIIRRKKKRKGDRKKRREKYRRKKDERNIGERKRENKKKGVLSSHSVRANPRILFVQIYVYNSFLLTL